MTTPFTPEQDDVVLALLLAQAMGALGVYARIARPDMTPDQVENLFSPLERAIVRLSGEARPSRVMEELQARFDKADAASIQPSTIGADIIRALVGRDEPSTQPPAAQRYPSSASDSLDGAQQPDRADARQLPGATDE